MSAHAGIGEADFGHVRRFVQIAAVDDDGPVHEALEDIGVRVAKFLPFGGYGQGVGSFRGAVGAVAIGQPVAEHPFYVFHGLGIEHADGRAGIEQLLDQHQRRRLADIVSSRLEGQSPNGNRLAGKVAVEDFQELLHEDAFLRFVDPMHGGENLRRFAGRRGQGDHGADVFGKT